MASVSPKNLKAELNFRIEIFDDEPHNIKIELPPFVNKNYIHFYIKDEDENNIFFEVDNIKRGMNLNIIVDFPRAYNFKTHRKNFIISVDDFDQSVDINYFVFNMKRPFLN